MAEGENIAGSAKLEITVDASAVEAALDAAVQRILERKIELPVGFAPTSTPAPAAAAAPAVAAAKATGSTQGIDAKVNAALDPVSIQKALDSHTFTLKINTEGIRTQIQAALNEPFNLTVNVHGLPQGQQPVSTLQTGGAPSATVQSGGTPTLAAAIPEFSRTVEAAFSRSMKGVSGANESLHLLYNNLNNALRAAGQSGLSGQTTQFGQFTELVDRLGPMADWFKSAGRPGAVSSGPAFDALRALGVSEEAIKGPNAPVRAAARTLYMEGRSSQGGGQSLHDISQAVASEISSGRARVTSSPQQVAEAVRAAVPVAVAAVQHEVARVAAPAAEAPTTRAADPSAPAETARQATVLARSTVEEFARGINYTISQIPRPVAPGTRPREEAVESTRTVNPAAVARLENERSRLQGRVGATLRKYNALRIPEGMDAEELRAGLAGQGPLPDIVARGATQPAMTYASDSVLNQTLAAVRRIREIDQKLAGTVETTGRGGDLTVRTPPDPDDVARPTGADVARVRRRGPRRRQGGELVGDNGERVHVLEDGTVERFPDQPSALPFDVDPGTGKILSAGQVASRSQKGMIPTPVNPQTGFSYGPIITAASQGAFSNAAMMLDERGNPTGEIVRYDPREAGTAANPGDPEVRKLMGGQEAARFGGGQAKGITPATAALISARATLGTKSPLIPASEFEFAPGGNEDESMALRVLSKLINPAAAAFDKAPGGDIDNLPGSGGAGQFNQSPRRMDSYVRADLAYAKAYNRLAEVQSQINVGRFSKTDVGLGERFLGGERGQVVLPSGERRDIAGSPDLLHLLSEQAQIRAQMEDLVNNKGANPEAVRFAGLPISEQRQAVRAARASASAQSAASRAGVEGRVGISDTTIEAEKFRDSQERANNEMALVAQGELRHLAERLTEGTLKVSKENLPPGYENLRTRPGEAPHEDPTTGEFIAQHVTAIMDRFRDQVGITKGRGTTQAPQEFSSVLQPYVSTAFDAGRESMSGRASLQGGGAMGRYGRDVTGKEGAVRGISFQEQDTAAREARSFAEKKYKDSIITDLDAQQVQARRRVNATARNEEGVYAETQDPQLVAARARINELRSQEAIRMERGYYSGTRSTRRGSTLVTRPEFVASGTSFDQFKKDQGETPEQVEIAQIEGRMDSLRTEAKEEVARIDRARVASIDLARRSTGQIHTASGVEYTNQNRNRLARSSRAIGTSEGYRQYTSPTRTGEEGAESLAGLSMENLIRILGPKVEAEQMGEFAGPGRPAEPFSQAEAEEIRQDAIQRIRKGDPRTGVSKADLDRRQAAERGAERGRLNDQLAKAQSMLADLTGPTSGGFALPGEGSHLELVNETKAEIADLEKKIAGLGESKGGISGDQVREEHARTRKLVPGITDQEVAAGAGAIAGGAGGAGGGGGGRGTAFGAPGGSGGFARGGQFHVIVDNPMPWHVSLDGGGTGAAASSGTPGEQGVNQRRFQSAQFGAFTSQAALAQAQRHIDRLRLQGFSDGQIASALKQNGLGSQASLLLGDEAGSATRNARRTKLGLDPVVSDITSPEFQKADTQRAQLSAEANASQRFILSRGFQASVTDLLQNAIKIPGVRSFEDQRTAVNSFTRESGQLGGQLERVARASASVRYSQEEIDKAREKGDSKAEKAAQKQLTRDEKTLAREESIAQTQSRRVDDTRKALPGGAEGLANLGVGAIAGGGAVALGSIVFQLSSQALAVAQQAVGGAIEELANQLTGFAGTAASVGTALGQAARAAGGDTRGAVFGALGQAGTPIGLASLLEPQLTRRAAIIAGNQALGEQVDLSRAAGSFASGDNGLFQPDAGGTQGIPGLTRSTGGILGTPIGAQPATLDQLTRSLPGTDTHSGLVGAFPFLSDVFGRIQAADAGPEGRFLELVHDQDTSDKFNATLKGWNDNLEKGSAQVRVFTGATEEQVKATETILASAGAGSPDIQRFKDLRIGFADETGQAFKDVSPEVGRAIAEEFLRTVATQSSKPTGEALLQAQRRPLEIQLGALDAQTALQQRSNSAQFALSNLASPARSLERTLFPGGDSAGVPASVLQTYNDLKDVAGDAFGEIASGVAAGREELKSFGLSDADIQRVQDLGQAIEDIQSGPASGGAQQIAASYADFAHNLEIGKRSLGDIVGLNGQLAASVKGVGEISATNLGVNERIVQTKSRELTLLGQELSQRQINFRVALAGFQSEGLTPEERAARQDQAKLEAGFAQRQLNLTKGITGAQFKIVDEQNLRALNDGIYNLEKLPRDFAIQVKLQGEAVLIQALSRVRDKTITDANTTIGKFHAIEELAISTAATIAQQTDEAYSVLLAKSRKTIAQIGREYAEAVGVTPSADGTATPVSPTHDSRPPGSKDTGGPGTPSNFSGNGVVIQFGDVHVRSAGDIDEIARKVEEVFNRKSRLLGLSAPVGS